MNDFERDPFKLWVLSAVCLFGAVATFAFHRIGGATLQAMPPPWGQVFTAGMAISSGITIYGVIRNKTIAGILYERAGLAGMCMFFLTYAVWAFSRFGFTATGFTLIVGALGIASIQRLLQIERRRRKAGRHGPT